MSYEIAQALVDIGGVGFAPQAPVTFKSGIKSPVYCDNRQFPFWPKQWAKVIRGFERLVIDEGLVVDVIGGIEAAGIPHSAALGYAMAMPSIFIRKEAKAHGAKKRVEGGDVQGKHVLLVEDLISTGGSSLSGVEALRSEGAIVTDCLAIISYGMPAAVQAFANAGVQLHALTNFETVLQVVTERSTLSVHDAATVRDWLHEPYGWASRNGMA